MDPLRRPLLVANWKMNLTAHEATSLARRLRSEAARLDHVDVVVAPPFAVLAAVAEALAGSNVSVAGQDLDVRADGATWVLLGGPDVARKLASAARLGLVPIVRVGDTAEDRARGEALESLHRQLDALGPTLATMSGPVAIVYEPLWATDTGASATASDIAPMHRAIRAHLGRIDVALSVRARILHGGAVTRDDALVCLDADEVDGVLVSMPGVDLDAFVAIATLADRLLAAPPAAHPTAEPLAL